MRVPGMSVLAMVAATALAAAAPAAGGERLPAKDGFAALQKVAASKDPDLWDVVLPAKLVESRPNWGEEETRTWREGLSKRLADAKVVKVREEGDDAVVRFEEGRAGGQGQQEIAIHWSGSRWVLASPQAWPISGKFMAKARGSGLARVRLAARKGTEDGYGKSAYSFGCATGDPAQCKGRMNLWYCLRGDMHVTMETRILDLGRTPFDKVDGIPVGSEWKRELAAVAGAVLAIHCVDRRGVDFFVKARVVSADEGGLELEWDLLAAGPGAPPSIHEPNPIESRDGADGADGMCGAPGQSGTGSGGGKAGKGGEGGK